MASAPASHNALARRCRLYAMPPDRPRRALRAVVLVTAVAAAGAAAVALLRTARAPRAVVLPTAPPIGAIPPDSAIDGPVVAEHAVGEYRLRVVEDTASRERVIDITRRGRRVFARRSADFRVERAGQDITGDGQPDAVIIEFTGGLHCCTRATILGLGREFRDYGTIDGADGEVVFEDVDRDGIPEVRVGDFRFAYWRDVPFSETPVPDVVMRFRGDHYEVACDLMRAPPPDDAALREHARELTRGWQSGDPPAELWGLAVDLVYGGNADSAWRLLALGWPAGNPGREEFVRELRQRLADSPCWRPSASPPAGG
jgi:hypothetical protein